MRLGVVLLCCCTTTVYSLQYSLPTPTVPTDFAAFDDVFGDGVLAALGDHLNRETQQDYSLTRCVLDVIHWSANLGKFWALKMLDANGKLPPSGLIRGNFYSLGQYDECLSVTTEDTGRKYKAKYCQVNFVLTNIGLNAMLLASQLLPNSTIGDFIPLVENLIASLGDINFKLGACIPDTCNMDEISGLITTILRLNNITFTWPILKLNETLCSTTDPYGYTDATVAAIVIFSIVGALVVVSTFYDIMRRYYYKEQNIDRTVMFLSSFSIVTNTEYMARRDRSSSTIRCLHAIRVMSVFWIALCHRFMVTGSYPIQNFFVLPPIIKSYYAYVILGGSVCMDSLLLVSGLLLAYVFLEHRRQKKPFSLTFFYIHRALKVWPPVIFSVLFYIGIYKLMGSGPMWPTEFRRVEACEDNWWTSILFVQNYVNPSRMCVPHLWFVAIETQLYILSPIILYPLMRSKKLGVAFAIFWLLASQASMTTMAYINNWRGIVETNFDYWAKLYHTTHTRASVWLLGFLLGCLLDTTKGKSIKMNKFLVVILWLISFVIFGSVVLGSRAFLQTSHSVSHLEDGTYLAFSRLGWGIGLCWLIFACAHGYGGPINWFLTINLWEVLAKMMFAMYIVHHAVQSIATGSSRIAFDFRIIIVICIYFADLVLSLLFAYCWLIVFESPFALIYKAIVYEEKVHRTMLQSRNKETDIKTIQ